MLLFSFVLNKKLTIKMISPNIENLIIKFVNKSATSIELDILNNWIKDSANSPILKEYVKTHYFISVSMNNSDPEEIRRRLLEEIRKDKGILRRIRLRSILKCAAVAIFFIGIGYFLQQNTFKNKDVEFLILKKEFITLELDNGDVQFIDENGASWIADPTGKIVGNQQGGQLVYDSENKTEKLVYNTLKVPYGKQFEIRLSDGTLVHLNSGTSLRYPVQFIEGKNRNVFLDGEAYFDVAESKTQPFIVNISELNVQVFGTEFNVSGYPEDIDTKVVLIEGSVGLYNSQNDTFNSEKDVLLRPSYMGSFNKEQSSITVAYVNTLFYTSWVKGNIVFRNEPFGNIIKKLERHYGVIIINNNETLANETFNANIDVAKESIYDVLDYFKKADEIKYVIVGNKIIIE